MKRMWTAVVLATYFLIGESMELPASSKMAARKSPMKPTMARSDKPNFNIVLRKIELDVKYGEYVSDKTKINVVMFNESMPVISGTLHFLKDLPQNMMIQVTGSRFSPSNQWIPTFDQGKHNYCRFVDSNKSLVKNVIDASDFKECPIKKGVNKITNMVVDEKEFPPGIPDCKFKIDAVLTSGNKKIAAIKIFADIVQKDDDDDD